MKSGFQELYLILILETVNCPLSHTDFNPLCDVIMFNFHHLTTRGPLRNFVRNIQSLLNGLFSSCHIDLLVYFYSKGQVGEIV